MFHQEKWKAGSSEASLPAPGPGSWGVCSLPELSHTPGVPARGVHICKVGVTARVNDMTEEDLGWPPAHSTQVLRPPWPRSWGAMNPCFMELVLSHRAKGRSRSTNKQNCCSKIVLPKY